MEHAKKMMIIDPEHYGRTRMIDKKMSGLDHEISVVLNSELPDDIKVKHYMAALREYRALETFPERQQRREAALQQMTTTEDVLKTVNPESRIKAERILKNIQPNLRWSDKGELIHDNALVPDSHIGELLNEASIAGSKENPIGFEEFVDTIKDSNIPNQFIDNLKLRRHLRAAKRQHTSPATSSAERKRIKKKKKKTTLSSPSPTSPVIWDES
jgi:hypothetical protein